MDGEIKHACWEGGRQLKVVVVIGRLGVLVEVNCETDFVARGDKFKELVADMAMQIAASPEVTVVSVDDVPTDVVQKETDIEMGKEDILSKPEQIRCACFSPGRCMPVTYTCSINKRAKLVRAMRWVAQRLVHVSGCMRQFELFWTVGDICLLIIMKDLERGWLLQHAYASMFVFVIYHHGTSFFPAVKKTIAGGAVHRCVKWLHLMWQGEDCGGANCQDAEDDGAA